MWMNLEPCSWKSRDHRLGSGLFAWVEAPCVVRELPNCRIVAVVNALRAIVTALILGVATGCVLGCGGEAAVSRGSDASVTPDSGPEGDVGGDAGQVDAGSIGTVEGTEFVVRSESAVTWGGPTYQDLGIGITTETDTECGPAHAGGWALVLYILGEPPPLGPGTYPIGGDDAGVLVDACLHGCGFPPLSDADPLGCAQAKGDGVIALTALSPRVTGSFDVTVDGVHLSGPIDATLCAPDAGVAYVGMLDECK
jgi:hypothetical protein